MTSDKSEFAKFKKIAGDDKVSTFQAMDKEEVEDEILEAKEEAQGSHLKVKDIAEVQVVASDDPEVKVEGKKVADALREELSKPKKNDPAFVRSIRKGDRHFNHTCAVCLKRKPNEDFYRGKKDQVCIDCGGK